MISAELKQTADEAISSFGRTTLSWLKKNDGTRFENALIGIAEDVSREYAADDFDWDNLLDYLERSI